MQSLYTPTYAVQSSPRRPTRHSGATTSVTLDQLYLSRTGNTYTTCVSKQRIKDTTRVLLESKDMLNAMWVLANQYVLLQNQYPELIKANKKVSYFVQQTSARTSQKVNSSLLDSSINSLKQILNQTSNSQQQQAIYDLQQETLTQQVNTGKLQQQELELSIELKKIAVEKASSQSEVKTQTLHKKLALIAHTVDQKVGIVTQIQARNAVVQAKKDQQSLRAAQLLKYAEPKQIIKDTYSILKKFEKPDPYHKQPKLLTIKLDETKELDQNHLIFQKIEFIIFGIEEWKIHGLPTDSQTQFRLELTYLRDHFDLYVSTQLQNYKSATDKGHKNRDLIFDQIRIRSSLACQDSILANQEKLTNESRVLNQIAAKHEEDMRVLQKEAQIKIQLNTQLQQELVAKYERELQELQQAAQQQLILKENLKKDSLEYLSKVKREIDQVQVEIDHNLSQHKQALLKVKPVPVRFGFWGNLLNKVDKDDSEGVDDGPRRP